MARDRTWTLTEAARLLGEPQHRLIYLCEKDLVVPDIEDARGRGSSRRFSRRNILEFAVALKLRDALLPASAIAAVIEVMRAFERNLAREIERFSLPDSLRDPKAPDLDVIMSGGKRLYFALGPKGAKPKLFGGVDIGSLKRRKGLTLVEGKTDQGALETNENARVQLNVTRIARTLPLEE